MGGMITSTRRRAWALEALDGARGLIVVFVIIIENDGGRRNGDDGRRRSTAIGADVIEKQAYVLAIPPRAPG